MRTDLDTHPPCEPIESALRGLAPSQGKGAHFMLNQRTQYGWWQASVASQSECNPSTSLTARIYPVAKRSLDLVAAAIALALLVPLFLLIAVAIKRDSPGPVFHVQTRTGRGGRSFRFYKFRSMTGDTDHAEEHRKFASAYINGESVAVARDDNGCVIYKPAANGQRITRVGRWLRRTSLDEIPQLINVLKWDMSLVGPRPTMDYETELYTDWHRRRLAVLPGLTGWAQIHGRSGLTFEDIVCLDVDYICQRSLALDIKILFATIPVVLSAEHAG
jgi:lipopolysaccharide/colanic/teichoic acid biosynthesis glycosyltransferase